MADELISVAEVAKAHATHKAQIFKLLNRLGIERRLLRSEDARGQKAAFISREDYERLRREFVGDLNEDVESQTTSDQHGFLYIIQLEPKLDPGRYKIGFATSVEERLRKHRTSAPFALVVQSWPCKLLWEKIAIDSITSECERLHTEVFRTTNIVGVVERGNRFFLVMPKLNGTTTTARTA